MNKSNISVDPTRNGSTAVLDRVAVMLNDTDRTTCRFPPTTLYNETWMLRLVVDWYDRNWMTKGLLSPDNDAKWYSEALLSSRFLRGAKNEGYTNADAVIGHFDTVGDKGNIRLRPNARQFVVVEAKMNSQLSSGTTHAPGYNQAARNVACMIHLIDEMQPSVPLEDCRFMVLAPACKLAGLTAALESKALIETIRKRAVLRDSCNHEADELWLTGSVEPKLGGQIRATSESWENVLGEIRSHDSGSADKLSEFYERCLEFNNVRQR